MKTIWNEKIDTDCFHFEGLKCMINRVFCCYRSIPYFTILQLTVTIHDQQTMVFSNISSGC